MYFFSTFSLLDFHKSKPVGGLLLLTRSILPLPVNKAVVYEEEKEGLGASGQSSTGARSVLIKGSPRVS